MGSRDAWEANGDKGSPDAAGSGRGERERRRATYDLHDNGSVKLDRIDFIHGAKISLANGLVSQNSCCQISKSRTKKQRRGCVFRTGREA